MSPYPLLEKCFLLDANSKKFPAEQYWYMDILWYGKRRYVFMKRKQWDFKVWYDLCGLLCSEMQEEQSSVSEGVSSEGMFFSSLIHCWHFSVKITGSILAYFLLKLCPSEFDKFLEDRAKAANHSSDIRSVPSSTSRPPPQSTQQQDKSHDQLFSL